MKQFIRKLGLGEYIIVVLFGLALFVSKSAGRPFALKIGNNFWLFFSEMVTFLPLMFILIGLIDVWFPKEKVERHIGPESGIKGIFWVVILAMSQAANPVRMMVIPITSPITSVKWFTEFRTSLIGKAMRETPSTWLSF